MNYDQHHLDSIPDYRDVSPEYLEAFKPPAELEGPIDWDLVADMFPTLFSAFCWILWGMFLLVPSLFGLHDAALFSAADNAVYVMMGFILCITVSTAIRAGHGYRAVMFALGLFLLSFWF